MIVKDGGTWQVGLVARSSCSGLELKMHARLTWPRKPPNGVTVIVEMPLCSVLEIRTEVPLTQNGDVDLDQFASNWLTFTEPRPEASSYPSLAVYSPKE